MHQVYNEMKGEESKNPEFLFDGMNIYHFFHESRWSISEPLFIEDHKFSDL